MNFLITIVLFLIVLFFYIHLTEQYKKSEDMEIYEMDYTNNKQLQETCNLKQPIVFEWMHFIPEFFKEINDGINGFLETSSQKNICVKDLFDHYKHPDESVNGVPLSYSAGHSLMSSDANKHFYTENNAFFVEETMLFSEMEKVDAFLKPPFSFFKKYDFMFGSQDAHTPLRFHKNQRKFLIVVKGKIRVKMTPYGSTPFLEMIKDYENYEFKSPVNVFSPPQNKHQENALKNVRFLEFDVFCGNVLFVPPYWWYSIKYETSGGGGGGGGVENNENEDEKKVSSLNISTFVLECNYNSVMNNVANLQDVGKYYLQQQNIFTKHVKSTSPIAGVGVEEVVEETTTPPQPPPPPTTTI